MSGGQFDWGGRLLKGNGGAQRFPQNGWKSFAECKGRRELDCETYKSSRDESRVLQVGAGNFGPLGFAQAGARGAQTKIDVAARGHPRQQRVVLNLR